MTPRQSRGYWRAVTLADAIAREAVRRRTVVCYAFGACEVCPLSVPCRPENGCGKAAADRARSQYEREERDETVADMNSYRARVL